MKKQLLSFFLFITLSTFSQNTIQGIVKSADSEKPLQGVIISVENNNLQSFTDINGAFILSFIPNGNYLLIVRLLGYETQKYPIELLNTSIDLGTIYLHKKIAINLDESSIVITDDELNADESYTDTTSGLLQASKDIFLRTVAFQFSSSFFNRRGLGSENATVLLNGIAFNKFTNGKPQWTNWGGLNHVTRNQKFTNGLNPSDAAFGGVLGATHINIQPSKQIAGTKLTYTLANRTYTNRFLATYASGVLKNNWAYAFSVSKRIAKEGFNRASSYDAVSFFTAVDKKINNNHYFNFAFIYAPNKRGKVSPNTQEVFNLKGIRYNEYWGNQNATQRNSRIKTIKEPILLFNYDWQFNEKTTIQTNISYQFGSIGNSRLTYTFASNPSPTYYQKLPSYAVAKNDLEMAYEITQNFKNDGQLNWNAIYDANITNAKANINAAYSVAEDRNDENQLVVNTILSKRFNNQITLNGKLAIKKFQSQNYAKVIDLLGAKGYLDFDKYGDTPEAQQNDLKNPNRIVYLHDKFQYNYKLFASQINTFLQAQFQYRKIDFFLAFNASKISYQREGLYENGSFLGNLSFGNSEKMLFTTASFKAGGTYKITGRHFLNFNAGFLNKPPSLQNTFTNPRESNSIVSDLKSEKILTTDMSYIGRGTFLNAKITGYYTALKDATKIAFFYADGISENGTENSAFVQEVLTKVNTKHLGVEFGLEFKITPSLQLNLAGNLGQYIYNNNPDLTLTSDSFSNAFTFKKITYLKDYKLANGPQKAYSVGLEYRDPDYWWMGLNANFFGDTYINIAPLNRTENFRLDTDGLTFNDYDATLARTLLQQERFGDYMTLNFVVGKSYKFGNSYVGVFGSIQNILGAVYKTGGFEQSRNANYRTLRDDWSNPIPLFGNKYWYGKGTTYFLNIQYSI